VDGQQRIEDEQHELEMEGEGGGKEGLDEDTGEEEDTE